VSTTQHDDVLAAPRTAGSVPDVVFHYTEDGTISRFVPHVPQTNPSHPPAVWAIDHEHSPLYWFPRDCPRISVWATDAAQQAVLSDRFETDARRICAAETGWVERIRSGRVYRYSFDAEQFRPWDQADGQYICDRAVSPLDVEPIDDLIEMHTAAEVELRFTPRLGTLMDAMLQSSLPFSFVRIRNALR
jgi:hypothetical protein